MLVDDVIITIKAGDGGNGSVSLKRNSQTAKGGPDGGNGGNGGDLYFQGYQHISDLREFRYKKLVKAEDGIPGKKNNLFGKNADPKIVKVPVGTVITETASGRSYEITDTESLVLLARGGKGGRGNNEFKSATNQTPRYAEPGTPGQMKEVRLELRLIADVGFVGLPNAGKSSLLDALTNAAPKIGAYPFTTLEPNLGVMKGIILADIPGLIEGASEGKGLGHTFLKHIEKTTLLVHCLDASDPDPLKTYQTVRSEFADYSQTLVDKTELILLTKSDLVDEKTLKAQKKKLAKLKREISTVTILDDASVERLQEEILTLVKKTKAELLSEDQPVNV